MTHNIEADGTMSSRTVSSSDYHAKCAGCVEKDREIASLTARIETSVGVDVWKMTVQEFERTIATLTAERDAANTEIARLIQANEHWHVRVTQLRSENDIIQATLDAHAESEASVCPEDVGCIEYIKVLQAKLGVVERALAKACGIVEGT